VPGTALDVGIGRKDERQEQIVLHTDWTEWFGDVAHI
jgi:hypothetical protein